MLLVILEDNGHLRTLSEVPSLNDDFPVYNFTRNDGLRCSGILYIIIERTSNSLFDSTLP